MKTLSLLTLFCWASLTAQADQIGIQIVEISDGEPLLVKALNGRVYRIDASANHEMLGQLRVAHRLNERVIVEQDDSWIEEIIEIESTENHPEEAEAVNAYYPTNFQSAQQVSNTFQRMISKVKGEAQCYQKAHFWAYNLDATFGVKSEKVFLFFTDRYIREYSYHWWYHVSPTVRYHQRLQVMDRFFTSGPLALKNWTDLFMKNKVNCRSMQHYGDYKTYGNREYCLVRVLPMYYYNPVNISALDYQGTHVPNWRRRELEDAYYAVGYTPR